MGQANRRLFFHGFVFFAIAPFTGFLIMAPVANPRAMMSLHISLWLTGALLCAAGAAWPQLSLSERTGRLVQHGLVLGMWFGLALGAIPPLLGTPTLFSGSGPSAPAWAGGLVTALQLAITVTLLPALIAIAVGLGRPAAFR